MTYPKLILFALILCSVAVWGCSSNTASSSGFGSGSGYSINLTTTQSTLPQGGSTTLIAAVRDAQGNPVNDSTNNAVSFTSSLGGTFTYPNTPNSTTGNIVGGVCTAIYATPATTISTIGSAGGVDQVTASYRGASAFVSIFVFRP
jgi:hypothetical protein